MKIVLSCGSAGWGGTEQMAELLAREIPAAGHDLVFFCRRGSDLHQRLDGVVPTEPVLGGADFHPGTVARCYRALRRHRPDVVLANTLKEPRWVGPAAELLGIPFVYRKEVDEPYRDTLYSRLIFGRFCDFHIVNSVATYESTIGSVGWVPPERVIVIPNGIDPASTDAAPPAELGLPDGTITFGFLGRFETRKGIFDLARAWPTVVEAIPSAHLVIAGWGAAEPAFREALGDSDNVHWLGFRKDVPAVMKAIDVLVAPSHYEGFGLVLTEAMAARRPAITTDVSSMPEIVVDGATGVVVEVKNPAALARAMIELGRSPEQRRAMGEAGRQRLEEEYRVELMVERHLQVLQAAIDAGDR